MQNNPGFMSVYIGKNIIRLDTINSTNSFSRELLKLDNNIPNGTVVVTKEQTSGKGYGKNTWESEAGKNLTFSLILYPDFIPPDEQFNISRAVSLGIYDYLKTMLNDVKIKWPNDIYVQDRKIAGILIENSISGNSIASSIIGVGLNVNQVLFKSDAPNPTSMKLRAAKDFDLHSTLKILLTFIENRFLQLETDRGYDINKEYFAALYRKGKFHYYEAEGEKFKAKIIDIEPCGSLVLETSEKQVRKFKFKEISFLI